MVANKTNNYIISFDPSSTAWGWVLFSGDNVVDSGCIKTEPQHKKSRIRKGDDDVRRVTEISSELWRVFGAYGIKYIVSELPHGSQSASSMKMVGQVQGLVSMLSVSTNTPVEWFSEGDAKKCLLGKRSATKDETITAIDKIYKVTWRNKKYIDEAVADACAIYHVASQQSPSVQMLKSF